MGLYAPKKIKTNDRNSRTIKTAKTSIKIKMITVSILAVFLYVIGFILFSGMYCGMEFTIEDLLICVFYPITMWFIK